MAKTSSSSNRITRVKIRMYRAGTGDCFLLSFMRGKSVKYRMMIDCGCINGSRDDFEPIITDLIDQTNRTIDLLVVTHQHADHINGFNLRKEDFMDFTFKKVWFAWTEDDTDPVANDYRKNFSELGLAVNKAIAEMQSIADKNHYKNLWANELHGDFMMEGKKKFFETISFLNGLNTFPAKKTGEPLPTMVELFKGYHVIKTGTIVEFFEPGDLIENIAELTGIRMYVLGPPKKKEYLDLTEEDGETFEKRKKKSTIDFAFISAVGGTKDGEADLPFNAEYEIKKEIAELYIDEVKEENGEKIVQVKLPDKPYQAKSETDMASHGIVVTYKLTDPWRGINHDWLYSAGGLALRYERSINNTSLALAIQFEDSERVLLFPGDAELGNWISWHDNLKWPVKLKGEVVQKNAAYFLEKTVFYKVGHHLSHNGTASIKGIDMMTSTDLTAMATVDLNEILPGWRNTMPNDLLGAELIRKTKGKIYFVGDHVNILKNIKTDRVTVRPADEQVLKTLNTSVNGDKFWECEIKG